MDSSAGPSLTSAWRLRAFVHAGIWFLLLAALPACDRASSSQKPSRFRAALLLPGSDNDKGWNQMAREGLDRIKAELGADTRLVTNVKDSAFASQIDYFAGEGYDLIICHGGEFAQSVREAVKKYPKVQFIVGGCPEDVPGAVPVEFMAGDASYLVGVVAANVSRNKTIAFVGAMPVPTLEACFAGLRDGAQSVAQTKVLPALWTNSWDSPQRAKEKTESAIRDGRADVIFQNVDAAAIGVFEAVKAANTPQSPVYAFGCNSNQNDLAADVILGSVVIDVQRAYLDLARQARNGQLAPGLRRLGLRGGYVDLVLNPSHPAIPASLKDQLARIRQSLLAETK